MTDEYMTKEYTIRLTEHDIGLLMTVAEGYAAHARIKAMQGQRDKEKTAKVCTDITATISKLYRKIQQIHWEE